MKVIFKGNLYQVYALFDINRHPKDNSKGYLNIYYADKKVLTTFYYFSLDHFVKNYLEEPMRIIISKDLEDGYCICQNLYIGNNYFDLKYSETPLGNFIIKPAMINAGL